jgi:hypothetical protein
VEVIICSCCSSAPTEPITDTPSSGPPNGNPNPSGCQSCANWSWGTFWLNTLYSPTISSGSLGWNNTEPTGGGGGIKGNGGSLSQPLVPIKGDKPPIIDTTITDSLEIITEPCDSQTIKLAIKLQNAISKIKMANNKVDSLFTSVVINKDTLENGLSANIDTLGNVSTTNILPGSTRQFFYPMIVKDFEFVEVQHR